MQTKNLIQFKKVQKISACLFFSTIWLLPVSSFAKTVMILGDSLSAGYGINPQQGWVNLLQLRLNQEFPKQHKVVNASVSGETTSGALARLPKLLQTHKPQVVVIELGGNDGLRGQPPQMIQKNLAQLIQKSQQSKATVVLLGMKIPPNYGTAYSKAFENNYKILSQQYKVKMHPFFMQGVAGHQNLMQKDLVHPNATAQKILLNNAYPIIKGAL
ncbi:MULTISPECIES: arylesterase [Acinetobacter]|uniref:Arylesterase n=1 Tax=Acinetobacter piscicola TaxID=2006115 RepID=A0A7S7AHV4_9GAMM|nr:arylesterase [Acinetobacter piscicola]